MLGRSGNKARGGEPEPGNGTRGGEPEPGNGAWEVEPGNIGLGEGSLSLSLGLGKWSLGYFSTQYGGFHLQKTCTDFAK